MAIHLCHASPQKQDIFYGMVKQKSKKENLSQSNYYGIAKKMSKKYDVVLIRDAR